MRYQRAYVFILVGWFLILVWGHYFNQRPLWRDEQCILKNIIQLKPVDLFSLPLLMDQGFPRFYLWVIQQFSGFFNYQLLALRFFSFVAMLGAFFVWLSIAYRVLGRSWDFILFVGCWCASMPLVYYAAELKPYSTDVLIAGLITLFLFNQDEFSKSPKKYRAVLFLMPLLGLLSYPAIFLLLLPLYNLIRYCFNERHWLPEMSFYLGGCVLMLTLVYLFDFRVSVPHLLEKYWHDYFISLDSFKDFFNSFGKGMNNLISRRLAESPRWIKGPSRIFIGLGVGYMLFAFWKQFKKDRFLLCSIIGVSFAMFLIQLVLALLRIFPFSVPRMSLFFSPLLFMMTILAFKYWRGRYKLLSTIFQTFFVLYLIFVSFGIAWNVFINKNLGAESTLYSMRGALLST